ncbi:MAG: hypothetical protein ACI835_004920 [Planctomycetota bacterium]|jgi:hypothetical protein
MLPQSQRLMAITWSVCSPPAREPDSNVTRALTWSSATFVGTSTRAGHKDPQSKPEGPLPTTRPALSIRSIEACSVPKLKAGASRPREAVLINNLSAALRATRAIKRPQGAAPSSSVVKCNRMQIERGLGSPPRFVTVPMGATLTWALDHVRGTRPLWAHPACGACALELLPDRAAVRWICSVALLSWLLLEPRIMEEPTPAHSRLWPDARDCDR